MFHNWTYAGWVTSEVNNVPPKAIRGNWQPIVTTEEFERGLAILDKRNQRRVPNRKHNYLLSGLVFYYDVSLDKEMRLTCSTPNTSRSGGGTPYYRIDGSNIRFLCKDIDDQIPILLKGIQVDPEQVPTIRSVYTHDVAMKMGHLRPDEKTQVELALKVVDNEESRSLRLYAAGKITEAIWDSLWREWQDRRNQLRRSLNALQERQQTHIENLDMALQVISNVGIVYNELSRDDKRELLRQMIERVIVDSSGNAKLKLRTPFTYLYDISDQIRGINEESKSSRESTKTVNVDGLGESECST